jgi:tetratricopeptide (TPR) repeat protein
MTISRIIFCCVLFLALPPLGVAGQKEFIESYTYIAGEADSKLTCRTVSLIEVKRLLLERIGSYLTSRTAVQNHRIEKDEIVVLTAGIVKLEILDETWNGETYTLTAKIAANPDDIARAIEDLRKQSDKRETIEKLNEINDTSLEQLREMQGRMQKLQDDLFRLNQDASANQGVLVAWGMYEKAVQLRQSGHQKEAVAMLDTVIQNNPSYLAYFERGIAHMDLGNYGLAIVDLTETLKVEPDMRGALWRRGMAYRKSGQKRKGRQDIDKAAALGSNRAIKWLEEHPNRK